MPLLHAPFLSLFAVGSCLQKAYIMEISPGSQSDAPSPTQMTPMRIIQLRVRRHLELKLGPNDQATGVHGVDHL